MKPAKAPPPALEKPRQPGRIRAVFLALLVHAAFFALIVFGITWQSKPAPPVEVTAPVKEPFFKMPPASETALMVCANPPRFRVPPLLTIVALPALNVFAAPPSSMPPLIVVAPL